jgi:hypothetical protein
MGYGFLACVFGQVGLKEGPLRTLLASLSTLDTK